MLTYAPLTLSRGCNIEKGRGGRNVKIGDWKTHAFNETALNRRVSRVFQLLLSMIVCCRVPQRSGFTFLSIRTLIVSLKKISWHEILLYIQVNEKKLLCWDENFTEGLALQLWWHYNHTYSVFTTAIPRVRSTLCRSDPAENSSSWTKAISTDGLRRTGSAWKQNKIV